MIGDIRILNNLAEPNQNSVDYRSTFEIVKKWFILVSFYICSKHNSLPNTLLNETAFTAGIDSLFPFLN